MKRILTLPVALVLFFAAPGAASAQEHVASAESLDAVVTSHAEALEADRAELRAFLARPVVAEIAADAGIDILSAQVAVAVLDAAEIRTVSNQVDRLDAALAGGDSVVISTTAIIVGLLILILVLVI
jgi:hypothetical protein